jgi:uncharacterized membrane protein SpoIIM required for sporulation
MQIGSSIWLHANAVEVIKRGFSVYYQIIIPLLLIAALIEAVLISNHLRSSKHPAAFSDEPLDAQ